MAEWTVTPGMGHELNRKYDKIHLYGYRSQKAVSITFTDKERDTDVSVMLNPEELRGLAEALKAAYDRTMRNG